MAVAVEQSGGGSPTDVMSPIRWGWDHIGWFLGILLVGGLLFLLWYMWKLREEAARERDSVEYEEYKNTIRDCNLQCDKRKVRTSRKFFFPLFKNEHSAAVFDAHNNLIGYYRGDSARSNGFWVLQLYKDKTLGLFEKRFLLRIPLQLDDVEVITDGKGNKSTQVVQYGFKDKIYFYPDELNWDKLIIRCWKVEKKGVYYRYPNFLQKNERGEEELMNLNRLIADKNLRSNYIQWSERMGGMMAKSVEQAALSNASVRIEQKLPEKSKEVIQDGEDPVKKGY